ncbi:MAG: adenylate/guanylate cyclase domain-containing protein [Proteobacteria bacterium]|nr:adenylate/guanylate cyclase domain-containing protein [Pseudomonadota bacterium]
MQRIGFIGIGILLLILMVAIRIIDPYPVRAVRLFYFDYAQRFDPREYANLPVRVVDIDDASLTLLGQWPWPRDRIGALVTRLTEDYGAAAVVFDVLFSEPDRLSPARILIRPEISSLLKAPPREEQLDALDNDKQLARAMEGHNVVLGLAAAPTDRPTSTPGKAGVVQIGAEPGQGLITYLGTTSIVPDLWNAAAGIGAINVSPVDASETVRMVPVMWNSPQGILPGMAFEALRVVLGESTIVINGPSEAPGVTTSVQIGDYEIPTTPDGQVWVRYRHEDPALYVPARAILAAGYDEAIRAKLEGQIVFVGTSAAGLLDIRSTPLGENVPGVSIHAQILEQVLTGEYLVRDDYISGLEIIAFICLSGIIIAVMSMAGPALSMAVGGVSALFVLIISGVFFQRGVLFDATFPMFGGLAVFMVLASYQFIIADREKRLIRKSFSHYVAPSVLKEIEKSGHELELGGQVRNLTVMFCDLRNFTPLSETMQPADLVSMLNNLFSQFSDCVLDEQGTIDKFVGDSIMAFWNAPLETEDHRRMACQAALNIRKALVEFNTPRIEVGLPRLAVGVGLCSGPACVGNIGSRQRYSYSAIGDTVNVAARMEASCRYLGYDVVISEDTHSGIRGMAALPAGKIGLKGKTERVPMHVLVGDNAVAASPGFAELQALHQALMEEISVTRRYGQEAFERCRAAAIRVEPGLQKFYDKLSERLLDF